MIEYRCKKCHKLLLVSKEELSGIEVKCTKCKYINKY